MEVELICKTCGKVFLRRVGEVNRNKKAGRNTYCSLSCGGKNNYGHLLDYDNTSNLQPGKLVDEFSPFRCFLKQIRSHVKKRPREVDITVEDLKRQWELQDGICPYTGWKMAISASSSFQHQVPKTPDKASVDRIDNSKGYVKGNIQFVSMMAQFAKNAWAGELVVEFGRAVFLHQAKN